VGGDGYRVHNTGLRGTDTGGGIDHLPREERRHSKLRRGRGRNERYLCITRGTFSLYKYEGYWCGRRDGKGEKDRSLRRGEEQIAAVARAQ